MLVVLLCVLFCACIFTIRAKSKQKGHELPPAYPGALPFIGHTHKLLTNSANLWLLIQDTAKDAIRQGGVTHAVLGTDIYYLIADAEDALVASNACTHKHFAFDFVKPWLGNGLITTSGELWKRHRQIIQPTFSLPVIHGFLDVFNSQARDIVRHMESQVGQKPFNPMVYLGRSAIDTFCQATFGIKDVVDMKVTDSYMTSAKTILSIATRRFKTIWLHSDLLFQLSGLKKKEQDAVENLKIMSHKILQRKRAAIINGDNNGNIFSGMKYKPALDHLLELSGDGILNDKEIREDVDTLVAAAFETLSHQLMYTLMFLGANPNVQNKMFEEIFEVLGPDGDVNKDDINRLMYTNAVIMESMRMIPPVPVLPRFVERDVKLKNYTMRAGSQCILYPLVYQNDHTWGFDEDKFLPERWLDNPELGGKKEFAGFGLGKRVCIGRQYAMVSMKVFLVHFIRQYKVTADMSDLKLKIHFVLKPVAGNQISITKRNYYQY